ncbi:MAG TPA: nucleotide kinase domain-containing protein, partial [Candidatus Saccharimonas sp.]|nr:nucleotide kinase domain-containing protein [Candidatus Saccharimonas sp.]
PIPRQRIYDLYWYFAAERQRIFLARAAGRPGPWTADPILQTYKFCNVFRAADRVSQYLIRLAYAEPAADPANVLFRLTAFRLFSRESTWDAVVQHLGHQPTLADLASGAFTRGLEAALAQHGRLYTGAFILCAADAYGQGRKHLNHVALLQHMFLHDDLAARLLAAPSLTVVYQLLHGYPLIGDFMAYQIAIDLNYSAHINFDENDFTQAGPGAHRGIRKAFESTGGLTDEQIIQYMVRHQSAEFARLGLDFPGLFGRPLHAIDAQGLFCELDKYCRQAAPELASNRTRIKARHTPSSQPLPLFFPPKWGLKIRPNSS